jgi:GntR family transcriptional regulator, rspAB operon transcriptional repressor
MSDMVPRERPGDVVYATLKRRILLNELKPEAILTELGIAAELRCSQGTVREALMKLREDGLVLRAGHRGGTTVTPLDADVAAEMLALRRRLETKAASRAALALAEDPAALARLEAIADAMDAAAARGDEARLIERDTDFHMEIFRLAGYRALEQILLRSILHSHRQKLWEPRHRRPLAETAGRHRAILAAIPKGGLALATALGQHIDTIVDVGTTRIAS